MAIHALVVAAGGGSRFGGATPKQYLPFEVAGQTACVLQYTLQALASHQDITQCTLVVAKDDAYIQSLPLPLPCSLVVGGSERWQSVANGVHHIATYAKPEEWVLIHDAARPCLDYQDLTKVIQIAHSEPYGAVLGVPVVDTLKSVMADDNDTQSSTQGGIISHTVPRQGLWQVQTPQVFRLGELLKVLDFIANQTDMLVTDEAMGFEAMGLPLRMVMGSPTNIKLTYPSDVLLVQAILSYQRSTHPFLNQSLSPRFFAQTS